MILHGIVHGKSEGVGKKSGKEFCIVNVIDQHGEIQKAMLKPEQADKVQKGMTYTFRATTRDTDMVFVELDDDLKGIVERGSTRQAALRAA